MTYAEEFRKLASQASNPKTNRSYRKILRKCENKAKHGGLSVDIWNSEYSKIGESEVIKMLKKDGFEVSRTWYGTLEISWL